MKILPEDLDEAIKQPWSTTTCLLAQAAKRETGKEIRFSGYTRVGFTDGTEIRVNTTASRFVSAFDSAILINGFDSTIIAHLRIQLPVNVRTTEIRGRDKQGFVERGASGLGVET